MAREKVHKVSIEAKAKTSAARKGLKDIQKGAENAGKSAAQASGKFASMSARIQALQKQAKSTRDAMDKMNRILGMAGIAGSAIAAAKAVDAIFTASAKTQGVMNNLKISLDGARGATKGWISDLELARNANRATDLGIAKTAEEFEVLAGAAFSASRRLGIDATEAMDTLTSAIANQSKARLDNLGIVIDVDLAQLKLANSLGISKDALNDTQKATAFQREAMEKLEEAARNTDNTVDALTDSWMSFRTELQNIQDQGIPGMINSLGSMEIAAIKAKNAVLDARIAQGDTFSRDTKARLKQLQDEENARLEAVNRAENDELLSGRWQVEYGKIAEEMGKNKKKKRGGRGKKKEEHHELAEMVERDFGKAGTGPADAFAAELKAELQAEEDARRAKIVADIELKEQLQENLRNHELAKSEIVFSERMLSLEMQQAEGIDPISLINAEEEARMALLEKQMEFADTEMEQMQIRDEMRQTHHEAELKRLDEQTRAEKAKLAHTQAVLGATASTFSHVGGIIQATTEMGIVSQRKGAGAMAVAKAVENGLLGGLEVSRAAAAAASYNIPQAVLHSAAAATSFANMGVALSRASEMGASGGGSAGGRPDMRFGGGGGGGALPQGGGGGGSSNDRPTVPGSGPPPVPAGSHGGGGKSGTVNVNIQGFVASTKEELGLEVRKALAASDQGFGEVAI